MTTRNLEIFVAVAECGSMSAAARKLSISQSAVSQVIVEIERQYNILLFERYSHTLHLTQVGYQLLDYAKKALMLSQETETFLLGANNISQLRVGASVTVGFSVLCPLLDELRRQMPDLDLRVLVSNTQEIEKKVHNYELDVAMIEGQVADEDLRADKIVDDHLVLICGRGHKFFGRNDVTIDELAGEHFILREEGSGTRALLEREMMAHKLDYDIAWISSDPQVIITAVTYNFGITALSPRAVQEEVKQGLLHAFEVKDFNLNRVFNLVYHKDKHPMEPFARLREICLNISGGEGLKI